MPARANDDCNGAVAVEFAFLAPIFIVMVTGIIAYGIYFGASNSLQQIAADAARHSIAGIDPLEREHLADTYIAENAAGYLFIDPKNLGVETYVAPDDSKQFVVVLTYDARNLPIWSLFRDLPLPGTSMLRKSTIRNGGL